MKLTIADANHAACLYTAEVLRDRIMETALKSNDVAERILAKRGSYGNLPMEHDLDTLREKILQLNKKYPDLRARISVESYTIDGFEDFNCGAVKFYEVEDGKVKLNSVGQPISRIVEVLGLPTGLYADRIDCEVEFLKDDKLRDDFYSVTAAIEALDIDRERIEKAVAKVCSQAGTSERLKGEHPEIAKHLPERVLQGTAEDREVTTADGELSNLLSEIADRVKSES